ncbi:MAG: SRPBCC family protein [Flavobacteriales bacterium]
MSITHIAKATTVIHEPIETVWKALLDPDMNAKFMMGARVITDWKEGSSIIWKGEWQGKPYEDRGTVIAVREPDMLKYTHNSGSGDNPGQQHTVVIELKEVAGITHVRVTQDNNADAEACAKSQKNWNTMLDAFKKAMGEAPVDKPDEMRV